MSLTSYVDAYCERVDPGFWSEPLNALTNAGFALAAWLLWRSLQRWRAQGARIPPEIAALPALMLLIAACSFAFHTLALVWAGLADQLSILLFGCVFLFGFLRRIAGLATWIALAAAILFSLASYFTPELLPPGFLNQSGAYFPYLVALLGMTIYLRQQERPGVARISRRHTPVLLRPDAADDGSVGVRTHPGRNALRVASPECDRAVLAVEHALKGSHVRPLTRSRTRR